MEPHLALPVLLGSITLTSGPLALTALQRRIQILMAHPYAHSVLLGHTHHLEPHLALPVLLGSTTLTSGPLALTALQGRIQARLEH